MKKAQRDKKWINAFNKQKARAAEFAKRKRDTEDAGGRPMTQFLGNLSKEEFKQCRALYEKATGRFWVPSTVKEQDLWILAFEQAKEHFNEQRN